MATSFYNERVNEDQEIDCPGCAGGEFDCYTDDFFGEGRPVPCGKCLGRTVIDAKCSACKRLMKHGELAWVATEEPVVFVEDINVLCKRCVVTFY